MVSSPDMTSRIDEALEKLGAVVGASESHGTLVGLFCAKGRVEREQWLKQIAPGVEPGNLLAKEGEQALGKLYTETARQLNDAMLEFQPLLPDDSNPLDERIDALGEWCQGFLMGLSEGGIKDPDKLPGDAAEIVRDFVELSRAGSYEIDESEEDENAFAELVEYVRTGVLLVNEEMNPIKARPRDSSRLH